VATYIPLIPLVILLVLLVMTLGGLGSFDPEQLIASQRAEHLAQIQQAEDPSTVAPIGDPLGFVMVIALLITYIVGFFATAGAAGVDFGMNARNKSDVQWGGLIGIALATLVTAGICVLVVAGVHGTGGEGIKSTVMGCTALMNSVVGKEVGGIFMLLLALAAFPPACFSSFVAANSFRSTIATALKVAPGIMVAIGAMISIILAVFGLAGKVIFVFKIIGASFGPICGAMMVDYLLSKGTWTGPRASFNPAGWISWALGFTVGLLDFLDVVEIPAAPMAAFIVGAVVYLICAKAGLQTRVIPYSPAGGAGDAPEAPQEEQS
jgi:cytosine permease